MIDSPLSNGFSVIPKNTHNSLHGGATATLVDLVGSAAIHTMGAPQVGVSVEINVSYLDAAYLDVSMFSTLFSCSIGDGCFVDHMNYI